MTLPKWLVGLTALAFFLVPLGVLADSAVITQIAFTSTAQTTQANVVSGTLTTQTKNAGGTLEQISGGPQAITLSSSSETGEFSSNATNWIPVTTLTMNSGTANRNFFYRDSTSGTHTLTVSAQGQSWTAATQTIIISAPPDTTAPVIAAHEDITNVEATADTGAVVTYTAPDATDNMDATAPASCTPAFGGTFALGTTQVTCTKTDAAGNSATPTTFSVTVVDTTPDQFAFTDRPGVASGSEIVSNTITVSGISTSTSISVTGGEYAINGGGYTGNSGTILNGDSVTVRHTSANANNGAVVTTLSIGGVSDTFTSTAAVGESSGGGGEKKKEEESEETVYTDEPTTLAPPVPVEVSPTVEPTIAATLGAPVAHAVEAEVVLLRMQALDLMYAWALSIQAELAVNRHSMVEG